MSAMTTLRPRLAIAGAAVTATALVLAACGPVTEGAAPAPSQGQVAAPVVAPRAAALACKRANGGDDLSAVASLAPGGTVESLRKAALSAMQHPNGNLVVGTSADVLLWGARDPRTGKLEGFDIALARAIAKALLGNENRIEFRVINYNQRIPALGVTPLATEKKAGRVDLVLHTMTINCDRWKRIAFSSEYYSAGQRVIVRADNPVYKAKHDAMQITDLPKGTRICVPDGSTNLEKLKASYTQYEPVPVPEIGECLVEFQQGLVDAITGDDTVLAGFAVQDPYAKIVGRPLTEEPYGIGVGKEDVALLRFVNAVLDELRRNNGLTRIYDDTMAKAFPPGTKRPAVPPAEYGRVVTP